MVGWLVGWLVGLFFLILGRTGINNAEGNEDKVIPITLIWNRGEDELPIVDQLCMRTLASRSLKGLTALGMHTRSKSVRKGQIKQTYVGKMGCDPSRDSNLGTRIEICMYSDEYDCTKART